jgi:5-formyltetrahydrofolate cyclo-ligase
MNTKNIIRKEILKARGLLSSEEVQQNSSIITNKLTATEEFMNSKLIMCYMDFRNEVKTDEIINKCLETGKRIAVPLVLNKIDGQREMMACAVSNFKKEMKSGAYGIQEPIRELVCDVWPEDIDLVIVPGVAFDERGYRIGYGAGYYDRFFRMTRKDCKKIGIAFEMQIVKQIPYEEHDVKLDMIITEKHIIV